MDFVAENLQALDRFENRLTSALAASRNAYGRLAIETFTTTPGDIMPMRMAYTSEVFNTLAESARKVIPYFVRLTQVEAGVSFKNDFETLYSFWINTFLFQHSTIIAETATSEITYIIQELIAEGAGDRQIANAIWDFSNASKWQARMIARTETHQAAMYAKSETATSLEQRSGIEMRKFWNATEDSRTRESHTDAERAYPDGIPLKDKFMVGGDAMDRPGDPTAGADNLINCRCVVTYRPAGF